MVRFLPGVLLLLCVSAPVLGAGPSGPAFGHAIVESATSAAEPRALFDPTDISRIFVVSMTNGTGIWISEDAGRSFFRGATTRGGGADVDAAVDADGVLYAVELSDGGSPSHSSVPISVSRDHGRSFGAPMPLAPGSASMDKPWLVAWGHGNVAVIARDFVAGALEMWRSSDGATTFTGPTTISSDAATTGALVLTASGHLVVPMNLASRSALVVEDSADGGVTWIAREVTSVANGVILYASLAVDVAGNEYVAYSTADPAEPAVYFSSVSLGASAWSKPTAISPIRSDATVTSYPSALFPWVYAGQAGHVEVTWLQSRQTVGDDSVVAAQNVASLAPETEPPTAHWDVVLARSVSAMMAGSFSRQVVISDVHTGSVCTQGIACPLAGGANAPQPLDRRMLDYFAGALDPQGRLVFAYDHDHDVVRDPLSGFGGGLDIMLARQTTGATL